MRHLLIADFVRELKRATPKDTAAPAPELVPEPEHAHEPADAGEPKDNGARFKRVLLQADDVVLRLTDVNDLAQFTAAMTVLAWPPFDDSKISISRRIFREAPGPVGSPQWQAYVESREAELPFDRYQRTKGEGKETGKGKTAKRGKKAPPAAPDSQPSPDEKSDTAETVAYKIVVDDKQQLIKLVSDEGKKADLLLAPYAALRQVPLAEILASKELEARLIARSTHPARLSYAHASGSFALSAPRPSFPAALCESDYKTVQTETFAVGNAAWQAATLLFIARIEWQGQVQRLHQALAQPEARAAVAQIWQAQGVEHAAAFLDKLAQYRVEPLRGEPQVFVGNVPDHEALSCLTPFPLFKEVARAKQALADAYAKQQRERADEVSEKIKAIDRQIAEVRAYKGASGKPTPAEREQKAERIAALEAQKCHEKAAGEGLSKAKELGFRSFELLYGGSNPQNLAAELSKSIHHANVILFVPVSRQHRVDQSAARSFVPGALLEGRLALPREMPRFLRHDSSGARGREQRRALFEDCAAQALERLLELQTHWLSRHDALKGEAVLDERAAELSALPPEFKLYVTRGLGQPELDAAQRRDALAALAGKVSAAVSAGLHRAYPQQYSSAHDQELREAALAVVRRTA
jgi:hypothetical protein